MAATKIPFRTAYSEKETTYQETGNGIEPIYGYELKNGIKTLVQTGEKNLYEEIQSYAEDVEIETILRHCSVGDFSDFRPQGIYQDISEVPNNLIEARKEILKLENTWQKLPKEIKEKYGWSVERFINEAGKESWLIDMGLMEAPKEPEVKPTEPETPKPEDTK